METNQHTHTQKRSEEATQWPLGLFSTRPPVFDISGAQEDGLLYVT